MAEPNPAFNFPPNVAEGAMSVHLLPAAGSPLPRPAKGLLIQTAGNLGVTMPDGTTNDGALVAVVAGQWLWGLSAISASASNTAVALAFI